MTIVESLLTYADLRDLPDDGKRYELLEGELVVSPAPTRKHQKVAWRVVTFLDRAEAAGFGAGYAAPFEVYFDEYDAAQPDVLFVRTERLDIIKEDRIEGAPDLVIEILSPSTRRRDLRVKLQLYARFGVLYYWIMDTEAATVQPYILTPQGYATQPLLHADHILSCPLFPGITIQVGDLFK
jgi:Uma2 family endonuclease